MIKLILGILRCQVICYWRRGRKISSFSQPRMRVTASKEFLEMLENIRKSSVPEIYQDTVTTVTTPTHQIDRIEDFKWWSTAHFCLEFFRPKYGTDIPEFILEVCRADYWINNTDYGISDDKSEIPKGKHSEVRKLLVGRQITPLLSGHNWQGRYF